MKQGKKKPSAADPIINIVKNPHFLVLISENFKEAFAALSPTGTAVTSIPPVSEPTATSVSPGLFNALFLPFHT